MLHQLKGTVMSERKFLVREDIEIDESVIDAVFNFMEERNQVGDDPSHVLSYFLEIVCNSHPSHVVLAMLCVVEMIQHASTGKDVMH